MKFLITLSWRNLWRHKGKSLAVGIILALGTVVMILGNGIISGFEQGLSKHFTEDFCGDLLLISPEQEDHAVLFPEMGRNVEPIANFLEVKPLLESHPDLVQAFLPAANGLSFFLDDDGDVFPQTLLGVHYEDYIRVFPNAIRLISGDFPELDQQGVLISVNNRQRILRTSDIWVVPEGVVSEDTEEQYKNVKSELVFLGFGDKTGSNDILSPVRAVFEFNGLNAILGDFNLIDIESFRQAMGYFSSYDSSLKLSAEEASLLDRDPVDVEKLFSEAFDDKIVDSLNVEPGSLQVKEPKLKQTNPNAGVFHQIFIKLDEGVTLEKGQRDLQQLLEQSNINLKVITWREAMGAYGQLAYLMRIFLHGMVGLVFLVAILIIVNTLTMAALERTVEIATMRAIGAPKWLIGNLFFIEPVLLAVAFGGLGICLAVLISEIFIGLQLSSEDHLLQLFFGGDTFHPQVTANSILLGIGELAVVIVVAVIYPVLFARKIKPIAALARQ